jgi:hypothetical protein
MGLAAFFVGHVLVQYLKAIDAESKWIVAAIIAGSIPHLGGAMLLIHRTGSVIAQIAGGYISRIVTEMKTSVGPGAFERNCWHTLLR